MPSPFPGMDPYLEGSLWMSVHTQLAAEIARQLAPKLRPRYLALTTERFVLDSPETVAVATSSMYPDVSVTRVGSPRPGGGIALAEPAPTVPVRLTTLMPVSVPHVTVEIRDVANRQLVTAIEVLSPTNKRGDGRLEYLAKRQRILLSTAHLLEIDLLREGQRVPTVEPLPAAAYYVFLSRGDQRPFTDVWPVSLRALLPVVPVPLLPGDRDIQLDLQSAFTNIYDLLGYDLAVDYAQPAAPPLSPEDAAWAEDVLAATSKGTDANDG